MTIRMDFMDALRHAVALHRQGRTQEAAGLYAELLRRRRDCGDAARLLALLVRHEDPARAVALVRQAAALEPDTPWVLSDLGLVLKDAGREVEAVQVLLRAARLAPLPIPAQLALAGLYHAGGQPEPALAAAAGVLAQAPDHPDARLLASRIAQDRGDDDAAAGWLRSVLACDPARLDGVFNLAIVHHGQGLTALAERHYRRAGHLAPRHPRPLLSLAQLWMQDGRLDAATAALETVTAGFPDHEEARGRLERCRRYRAAAAHAVAPGGTGDETAKGLVVRGAFRDTSGYAHMVRCFVRGLTERALAVDLIDLSVDFVPAMADAHRDPRLERLDRPAPARGMVTFAVPPVVERAPGLAPVNFSMFEAHPAPASWVRHADRLACIIVPTESSRQAWLAAGLPADRLRLCPLGVAPAGAAPVVCVDARTGRRLADFRVRMLNVSDMIDRKNLPGVLRVWFQATHPDDDAVLVLKMGKGAADIDSRAEAFIDHIARSVGKRRDQAGPVFVLQGALSDQQMAGVFAACTHYISLSHGEGWDLPMTQAGAAGLTLIAPRHSAYETYLDDSVAHMVPSVPAPAGPPYAGLDWWDPDEDAAAGIVRAVITGCAPVKSARARLLRDFGWPAATDRLIAILQEVGAL